MPKELAHKQALCDKLVAARGRLEAQAKARAAAERADYEAKVAAREQRQGRAKGKRPKPPDERPRPDEQSNLSDPDSRLMRKSKHHEYRQAYNAQAVVDAGGSQLILGARVSNCASDRNAVKGCRIPAVAGCQPQARSAGVGQPLTRRGQIASLFLSLLYPLITEVNIGNMDFAP